MTEINLLPWRELKREREKKAFMMLMLASAIIAILVIIVFDYYSSSLVGDQMGRNKRLQTEIDTFNQQIVEIKKLKELRNGLISRMRVVQAVQSKRTLTVHLFDELIKVLPDGVYLSDLKRTGDSITVKGYSESNSNVSLLMRNIQSNPWIQNPVLTEIKKAKEGETQENNEFTLSFVLQSKTSDAPTLP